MTTADPDKVIAAARNWIGTPYHNQASLNGVGCDCLGLVRGVWREVVGPEPDKLPRYSRDWGETSDVEVIALGAKNWLLPIALSDICPGSVLVFRMRRGAIAKHLGIMSYDGMFIHSYDRLGVIEQKLTEPWRRRLAYAYAYPAERPEVQ